MSIVTNDTTWHLCAAECVSALEAETDPMSCLSRPLPANEDKRFFIGSLSHPYRHIGAGIQLYLV
ncbi:hypothetical protein NECAME_18378 [Necator americanus]|uniref:Uncharacterized protein n=1 Tax=Necator americanus TaxID=51031 RepID=W2SX27_NECAM|nr:hypothetical protein NECAME_18378 [Necator americanus]ETN73381.1 hypothetical protein NECAME_18378 [Necator americanus]